MTWILMFLASILLGWLAPAVSRADGLKAIIVGVDIGSDRRPVATIKISDAKGKSLELADLDAGSMKLTSRKFKQVKAAKAITTITSSGGL